MVYDHSESTKYKYLEDKVLWVAETLPGCPAGPYLGRGARDPGNLSTFGRIPGIDVKCRDWTGPILSSFSWRDIKLQLQI